MAYRIVIGYATASWDHPGEQEAANQFTPVPFTVDTLEEARLLTQMSKSPVWYIEEVHTSERWSGKEVEASTLLLHSRELGNARRQKEKAAHQALIQRINAQPKTVTRTYEGIAVTFERSDVQPQEEERYGRRFNEAAVRTRAVGFEFPVRSFITSAGNAQKAKWRKWLPLQRQDLAPLADYLKDIAAVADQLAHGNYKEDIP